MATKHGVFFINQRVVPAWPDGTTTVDQMHVTYDIPLDPNPRAGLPIVMVPGGFHTGAVYDETPDGRPGWWHLFLELGHPVYRADHVGHGASGFAHRLIDQARIQADASILPPILFFTHETVWPIFRFGSDYPKFFDDTQFPTDALDHYWAQIVPNTEVFQDDPAGVTIKALGSLLERIGPAILLVHSQSGRFAIPVAANNPELVAGVIAVEPACGHVPGADDPMYFDPRLEQDKPVEYRPWLKELADVPFLFVWGDHMDAHPFWDVWTAFAEDYCRDIESAGGRASQLFLPDVGIRGNTHMLMLERNNLEIGRRLAEWIRSLDVPQTEGASPTQ